MIEIDDVNSKSAIPFLRWTGSKKWFVKKGIEKFIPKKFLGYHEPFLGCGAIFFHLNPNGNVYLNDLNDELINAFVEIQKGPQAVISSLKKFKNSEEDYYRIRSMKCRTDHTKAARFIYLNRTAFNGIYRVNPKGGFNVPYGRRKNVDLITESNLIKVHHKLQGVELSSNDFYSQLKNVRKDDLVYLDPPYTVAHENNGFIAYNSKLFSLEDQERLVEMVRKINEIGAYYILSNAEHPTIRSYYRGVGEIYSVERPSIVGGRTKTRRNYKELIITNVS
ncbi:MULTISPECIES: DNA adenine methylase [Flavobacteriaceae]|uniref:DNA adenine methylase n=1 Tax=Flavobacteriaceae TaxID=49546 RepID=UPI00234B5B09|nr:Dam family site-specific DNA-(adenine-N6)-methyltransferase [Muricauda sp. SP22]MDC6362555.1 Dam family site-specific DNA-(adenine-N6)-methyltransferase [Muricauda sp. SP22]